MTFDQWFRQHGSLVPMSWPDSREKQAMELARAAWEAGCEDAVDRGNGKLLSKIEDLEQKLLDAARALE